jgi:hypothetical protein
MSNRLFLKDCFKGDTEKFQANLLLSPKVSASMLKISISPYEYFGNRCIGHGALSYFRTLSYIEIKVQVHNKCFPMSHAASMFRKILADDELSTLFADAPPETLENLREFFGVVYTYGEFTSGFWFSAAVLAVTTVAFYVLSLQILRQVGGIISPAYLLAIFFTA